MHGCFMENYPNLALAGAGMRGIGIPDCIHSGELAVERNLLTRRHERSTKDLALCLRVFRVKNMESS